MIVVLLASCTATVSPKVLTLDTPTFTPCLDTLGAAKYPEVLRYIPSNYAIGAFSKEFGDFFPIAKRELDRGRPKIRVQLTWSNTHTYGDKDIPFLKSESKRYEILCGVYSDRDIELSAFTEHNVAKPDKYLDIVHANAPHCKVVNNPWKGGLTKNPLYKNEVHGGNPPRVTDVEYNFSYDGTNAVDENVEADFKKYSDADILCVWHPRLNLRWNTTDPTPVAQRTAKPDRNMIESLVYLFSGKGATSVPAKWIIKSHSEKHNAADLKGDKLLIISPVKGTAITLKRGSKVIAVLPYYGSYEGGGWRYYSTSMGYKLGTSLDIYIGGKKYGTINGGFRDGIYR